MVRNEGEQPSSWPFLEPFLGLFVFWFLFGAGLAYDLIVLDHLLLYLFPPQACTERPSKVAGLTKDDTPFLDSTGSLPYRLHKISLLYLI